MAHLNHALGLGDAEMVTFDFELDPRSLNYMQIFQEPRTITYQRAPSGAQADLSRSGERRPSIAHKILNMDQVIATLLIYQRNPIFVAIDLEDEHGGADIVHSKSLRRAAKEAGHKGHYGNNSQAGITIFDLKNPDASSSLEEFKPSITTHHLVSGTDEYYDACSKEFIPQFSGEPGSEGGSKRFHCSGAILKEINELIPKARDVVLVHAGHKAAIDELYNVNSHWNNRIVSIVHISKICTGNQSSKFWRELCGWPSASIPGSVENPGNESEFSIQAMLLSALMKYKLEGPGANNIRRYANDALALNRAAARERAIRLLSEQFPVYL